jgi:hypothetical protein
LPCCFSMVAIASSSAFKRSSEGLGIVAPIRLLSFYPVGNITQHELKSSIKC